MLNVSDMSGGDLALGFMVIVGAGLLLIAGISLIRTGILSMNIRRKY